VVLLNWFDSERRGIYTPKFASTAISTCGQVAQLVEQRTENPRVGGSIPSLATKKINMLGLLFLVAHLI
jgi:hypothetical protein